jgi:hypothetical protein
MVPLTLQAEWKRGGVSRVIAQAELLPILVAKRCWGSRLLRRRVLCFVDNESAKHACINMDSASLASRNILSAIADEEQRLQTWSWYTRVPSHSNPSDAASRLKLDVMRREFEAVEVPVRLPDSLAEGKWPAQVC